MESLFYLLFTCILVLTICERTVEASKAQVLKNYGKIPLAFTANQGQFDPLVKFTAQGSGCTMFFTPEGTTYLLSHKTDESLARQEAKQSSEKLNDPIESKQDPIYKRFALKVKFLNANSNPEIIGEDRLKGKRNYFFGNDKNKWKKDVATYKKIRIRNLYKGIDLVYYGNQNKMEYDFIVQPGIKPSQILLRYDRDDNIDTAFIRINEKEELVVSTPLGDIIEKKPYSYQVIDGEKIEVEARYCISNDKLNSFTFRVAEYNPSYPLFIDPELIYSTLVGGSGRDSAQAITIDGSGNAYIVGFTLSLNFPTTPGAYDDTSNGHYDVLVTKLNASGTALVYSTYLGGSSEDRGVEISVDENGNAYVTGYAYSSNFPTTSGVFDETHNGGYDVFITKLDAMGSTLLYSTFIGGSGYEYGRGIFVDSFSNLYISGTTSSLNFPTTPGAFCTSHQGGEDAFVVKLNNSGDALLFSTFLGGSYNDGSSELTKDSYGNSYITGYTYSSDFPTTLEAYDRTYNGNRDIFVVKLNDTGSDLYYSTFIGGSYNEWGRAIIRDNNGNVYITGETTSSDFPTIPGSYDTTYNGTGRYGHGDAYVIKINNTGSEIIYSTFLGGTYDEYIGDIYIDESCNAYVAGHTTSPDFPVTTNAYDDTFDGPVNYHIDGILCRLNSTGSDLLYSTFLGGDENDACYGIINDEYYNVYIAGQVFPGQSTSYPTTPDAYDPTFNGEYDACITKFSFEIGEDIPPVALCQDINVQLDTSGNSSINAEDVDDGSSDDCGIVSLTVSPDEFTCADTGPNTVTLTVTDNSGNMSACSATVTVEDNILPVALCQDITLQLDASGNASITEGEIDNGSSDACGIAGRSVSKDSFDCDNIGPNTVTLTVTDINGNQSTCNATVTIMDNVSPEVEDINAILEPVLIDTEVETNVSFKESCPDVAIWDWGDETSDTITEFMAPDENGKRALTGNHVYTILGVYTVKLTVWDDQDASGESIFRYIVIYDPEGAFVTGGGWIMSPEGAYVADPLMTGKADFGFVSKYKKGAEIPTGNTQFQLKAGDLNFCSSSYDWLVVTGAKAQYKGVGTINGNGEYIFMLKAIDADINENDEFEIDRFRIKIWEEIEDEEHVIYDNTLGSDDDLLATEIGGGSVMIHN